MGIRKYLRCKDSALCIDFERKEYSVGMVEPDAVIVPPVINQSRGLFASKTADRLYRCLKHSTNLKVAMNADELTEFMMECNEYPDNFNIAARYLVMAEKILNKYSDLDVTCQIMDNFVLVKAAQTTRPLFRMKYEEDYPSNEDGKKGKYPELARLSQDYIDGLVSEDTATAVTGYSPLSWRVQVRQYKAQETRLATGLAEPVGKHKKTYSVVDESSFDAMIDLCEAGGFTKRPSLTEVHNYNIKLVCTKVVTVEDCESESDAVEKLSRAELDGGWQIESVACSA